MPKKQPEISPPDRLSNRVVLVLDGSDMRIKSMPRTPTKSPRKSPGRPKTPVKKSPRKSPGRPKTPVKKSPRKSPKRS